MKHRVSPYSLGATLYMPAIRDDILDVILNNKIEDIKSLVICLEDSVLEADVPKALINLEKITQRLKVQNTVVLPHKSNDRPLVFIRPRDPQMGEMLVNEMDLSGIDGFVLPKFDNNNIDIWNSILLKNKKLLWMPTLETSDVYDVQKMQELATKIIKLDLKDNIIALRIGGNDLMSVMGLRKSKFQTLYNGPLGYVTKMLTAVFGSKGFFLTSPVCELIDNEDLLTLEFEQDLENGIVGKTAIHPKQISIIHQKLAVAQEDYEDALKIINAGKAVFKSNGAMCEPATHLKWAKRILERKSIYGLRMSELSTITAKIY